MHEVLVNRLGGLSLPRKSVVRLTDRPDMTVDVYRGRKTTKQSIKNEQHSQTLRMSKRDRKIFCNKREIEILSGTRLKYLPYLCIPALKYA